MSLLRRYLDPKILTAIALPALVVGVPVLILLVLQFRSLNQFEATTARLLEREAVRLAEDLGREIRDDLREPLGHLQQRIDLSTIDELPSSELRAALDGLRVPPLLDSFFAWSGSPESLASDGSDTAERQVLFFPLSRETSAVRQVADSPVSPRFGPRPERARVVWRSVWSLTRRRLSFGTVDVAEEGTWDAYLIYVSYRPGSWEPQAFYGFHVDLERARRSYFPDKVTRLRDQGRRSMSTLEVTVADDRDREIYLTGPPLEKNIVGEQEFPVFSLASIDDRQARTSSATVPTWTVRTGYPGTSVAALAHGRINQQRYLLFLVAVIAVVGITLASRATAQELRLADLKSEFVSSVSHDLKTPLASIQMFAETLESGRARTPEKVREYGEVIGLEARQLGHLIDGILDFDKIESGSRRYPVEEIGLGDLLQEAVDCFEHQLQESGFTTELDLPEEEILFVGNRDGLLQVFKNLISNAVKYSIDEHYLGIRLHVHDDNAVIEVVDHGIGVPPRERSRIFEKFYRATRDPTTDATGTGLGLAIAKHVVRAHGGRIHAAGADDGASSGSTFIIELPLWYEDR